MAVNIKALDYEIRYIGLFDFDGIYATVIDWAKNYGYKWHESVYKHKVPSPAGAEQELRWQLTKNISEYIGFRIDITVHVFDLTEVVVNVGKKRKILTNGRVLISIKGTVIADWQNKFESKSRFVRKLGEWYTGVVLEKQISSVHWDVLNYRMGNLHALLKQYFDMQTKKNEYEGYLGEN